MISEATETLDQSTVQRLGLVLVPKPLDLADFQQLVLDTAKPITFKRP